MTQRLFTGLLVLAAILASLAYLWKPWTPDEAALKLGLDLQGGLRVVLQIRAARPRTPGSATPPATSSKTA